MHALINSYCNIRICANSNNDLFNMLVTNHLAKLDMKFKQPIIMHGKQVDIWYILQLVKPAYGFIN